MTGTIAPVRKGARISAKKALALDGLASDNRITAYLCSGYEMQKRLAHYVKFICIYKAIALRHPEFETKS
jgi:hypothetical protein